MEHTRSILRERGLNGLIVVAAGHEDPNLAPYIRALRDHASQGSGADRSQSSGKIEKIDGMRFGPSWLFVGLSGGLHLLPESPWELGDVRRCGFEAVDGRRFPRNAQSAGVDRCRALAEHCGVAGGQIGVAGAGFGLSWRESGQDGEPNTWKGPVAVGRPVSLMPAEDIPSLVRRFKTPSEICEIERVASASDACFLRIAELLAASIVDGEELWLEGLPVTVGRLAAVVREVLLVNGLKEPERHLIAVGAKAAEPHHCGEHPCRVRVGASLIVDLFPKGELFSDCTRTFCIGGSGKGWPEDFHRATRAVEEVKLLVERNLNASLEENGCASGYALQKDACSAFNRLGWTTQLDDATTNEGYIHGLGHGVGDALHEAPMFSIDGAGKPIGEIVAGDVITLEPGLYRPGKWGIRFEDLYAVEERGGQVSLRKLSKVPWALDPKEFLARAHVG